MLGCVVSISASSSLTFFSPLHRLLMIFSRIGADITRKISAASSNTSSVSTEGCVLRERAAAGMAKTSVRAICPRVNSGLDVRVVFAQLQLADAHHARGCELRVEAELVLGDVA